MKAIVRCCRIAMLPAILAIAACGGEGSTEQSAQDVLADAAVDVASPGLVELPASDTVPVDAPSVPVSLSFPVPPAWQAAGAVVSATVLSPDRPADERSLATMTGHGDLAVQAQTGDLVVVSLHDADGRLLQVQAMTAEQPDWAPPGEGCATHWVPTEYPTIQAAVDVAKACDTVRVLPGTYREFVTLRAPIRLIGSGALLTVLDGSQPEPGRHGLVDFTEGPGSLISGFRFTGIPYTEIGCADTRDPFLCSGDWYVAAVYGDGHSAESALRATVFLTHNIFDGNYIAVMAYFHALAVVRNNVFTGNTFALVTNHFNDQSLIANNVFYRNTGFAIGSHAAWLDVVNNVFVQNGEALRHEYIQTGRVRCNLFWENTVDGERVPLGVDGNVALPPGFLDPDSGDFGFDAASPALDAGCFEGLSFDVDGSAQDMGAYGGPFGAWEE